MFLDHFREMLRRTLQQCARRRQPILLATALACLALACQASETVVRPGASVQRAIDSASAGDKIVLAPGRHFAGRLRLRSGLMLRGGPDTVVVGSLEIHDVEDVEIRELRLESPAEDCVHVDTTTGVRIRASDIGPCQGNAIVLLRSDATLITDNYIHPEHPVTRCCDNGDGVYGRELEGLRVAGNVIAYGETNVEVQRAVNVEIVGNYMLNPLGPFPRGQQVQVYDGCRQVRIEGNFMEAVNDPELRFGQRQEDAINVGQSSDVAVTGNFVFGGESASGCGIIADQRAHEMAILDNTLWQTGQCGIGIASGRNHRIVGNRIRNSFVPHPGAGNTAIYVWRQYAGECGPVRVSGNIAYAAKPTGEPSSFWKGGSQCDPVTLAQNVFGEAARQALSEDLLQSLRPAIPPQPQACVAPSPYSDRPSPRPCLSSDARPEEAPKPLRSRTRPGNSP